MAYGAFDEVTPDAEATVDRLIDALAARGIATIAWTVPRTTAFDDLARAAASAAYRTPAGNGVAGIAVDLERGGEFLGSGPVARAALASYLGVLRRAVGPRVLLVATVEDPALEHLGEAQVPYREIARDADVLQPMTYWRMLGSASTPADAAGCRRRVGPDAATARAAGRADRRRRPDRRPLRARRAVGCRGRGRDRRGARVPARSASPFYDLDGYGPRSVGRRRARVVVDRATPGESFRSGQRCT